MNKSTPYYYTTASKSVGFLYTTISETFPTTTINTHSSLPSLNFKLNLDSSENKMFCQVCRLHQRRARAHWSLAIMCRRFNSIPLKGWREQRPDWRNRLWTVWSVILLLRITGVRLVVSTAETKRLRRWISWMCLSWRNVVSRGLPLRRPSDVVPVLQSHFFHHSHPPEKWLYSHISPLPG